jgi:hypothetical protein
MKLDPDPAGSAPPEGIAPPLAALWWLAKGRFRTGPEWERAHGICQSNEGDPAHDLVHAVAHLAEGDLGNADYWFRRAGRNRQGTDARAEWHRAALALGAEVTGEQG